MSQGPVQLSGSRVSNTRRPEIEAIALRQAYQKNGRNSIKLVSKSSFLLCNEMDCHSGSKSRYLALNHLSGMMFSSIHHLYAEKGISDLEIEDPGSLSRVGCGVVGEYCGIPIYFNSTEPMAKLPAMLINSRAEFPLFIEVPRRLDQFNSSCISLEPQTMIGTCTEVIDNELRTAMESWRNVEEYKRFIRQLRTSIENGETPY